MTAADRIAELLGVPVTGVRSAGAQHGYQHLTARLADGRQAFVKAAPHGDEATAGAFAAEANGLRWLAEAGAVPLPEVLGVSRDLLVIELLPDGRATPDAAEEFGAGLARMHAAGAASFGAPWPGYLASLPLDNTPGTEWGSWYAEQRLVPYLKKAHDDGALDDADLSLVETVVRRIGELAGPPEPPSRIHGDLWAGNVLWSGGRGWLIDPAAHGGHRETDLAMLALFGAPHLERIVRGYTATAPLAGGWRARVPLHQLHPLLVHACLFGGSYAAQVRAAARAALTGFLGRVTGTPDDCRSGEAHGLRPVRPGRPGGQPVRRLPRPLLRTAAIDIGKLMTGQARELVRDAAAQAGQWGDADLDTDQISRAFIHPPVTRAARRSCPGEADRRR